MAQQIHRRRMLQVTGGALVAGACGDRGTDTEALLKDVGAVVAFGADTAAEAGQTVLAEGGNAIDAAVTAALTAGTVHVSACGIAGYGGHMTIALAKDKKVTCIDFNSTAPAAMRENTFAPNSDGVVPEAHDHGWLSAGVPGTLAGLDLAIKRYGSRTFREALQPAIRFAREGFAVDEIAAQGLPRSAEVLRKDPAAVALLFPDGEPVTAGTVIRNPKLVDLLERLADENSAESFYRGDVAQRIAAAFQKNGGLVTAEDFAAHQAREVEPVRIDWRGYAVYTGPLTAGGTTSLQALKTLKALSWENEDGENRKNHARLEALRIAWNDRLTLFGDPEKVNVPLDHLLSDEYAEESAARIREAVEKKQPLSIETRERGGSGTVHISAVDRDGNMVALTLTHGANFGARVVVEDFGLILGHGMSRFDPRPGQSNSPGPGKRPLHNMCPTVVLRDGNPMLALGGRGGRRIPNAVFDVLSRFVGEDRSMAESVEAPRMHTEGSMNASLDDRWDEPSAAYIRGLGYDVNRAQSARISAVSFDPVTGTSAGAAR